MGADPMITCRQVSTLVTSGEIEHQNLWKRIELRFHLWMCRHCSRLLRQVQQIRDAGRLLGSSFESERRAGDGSSLESRILSRLKSPPAASDDQAN